MKSLRKQLGDREGGGVAVEFAILLVFLIPPLLAASLFFGRVFWHYTVAEKAARDGARFLASSSAREMKTQGPSGEPPVVTATRDLVEQELAELNTGGYKPDVAISCDGLPLCSVNKPSPLVTPQTITVWITMNIEDPFLGGFTAAFFGNDEMLIIPIDAVSTINYVGN